MAFRAQEDVAWIRSLSPLKNRLAAATGSQCPPTLRHEAARWINKRHRDVHILRRLVTNDPFRSCAACQTRKQRNYRGYQEGSMVWHSIPHFQRFNPELETEGGPRRPWTLRETFAPGTDLDPLIDSADSGHREGPRSTVMPCSSAARPGPTGATVSPPGKVTPGKPRKARIAKGRRLTAQAWLLGLRHPWRDVERALEKTRFGDCPGWCALPVSEPPLTARH